MPQGFPGRFDAINKKKQEEKPDRRPRSVDNPSRLASGENVAGTCRPPVLRACGPPRRRPPWGTPAGFPHRLRRRLPLRLLSPGRRGLNAPPFGVSTTDETAPKGRVNRLPAPQAERPLQRKGVVSPPRALPRGAVALRWRHGLRDSPGAEAEIDRRGAAVDEARAPGAAHAQRRQRANAGQYPHRRAVGR